MATSGRTSAGGSAPGATATTRPDAARNTRSATDAACSSSAPSSPMLATNTRVACSGGGGADDDDEVMEADVDGDDFDVAEEAEVDVVMEDE